MNTHKTIRLVEITAYKSNDNPTCAIDFSSGEVCAFVTARKLGLVYVCSATGLDIEFQDGGLGYSRPSTKCPVWKDAA